MWTISGLAVTKPTEFHIFVLILQNCLIRTKYLFKYSIPIGCFFKYEYMLML